jgi:hypothetical protein
MNRQDVLNKFEVREDGVIKTLGAYEGQMLYVPAAWEFCLDGMADFDEGSVYGVIFTDEDRLDFPEISNTYGMLMEQSDKGFIHAEEYETKEAFEAAVERVRAAAYWSDSDW